VKRFVTVAAMLLGEVIVFLLVLVAVTRSLGDASRSLGLIAGVLGAAYLVIGAVPAPRNRRPLLIGASAFVVPLVVLGWIGWRTEYSLLPRHLGAWEDLPSLVLAPANLTMALFLSSCALVGHVIARRVRRRDA